MMMRIVVAGDIRLYRDGVALDLSREPAFSVVGAASDRSELMRCVREERTQDLEALLRIQSGERRGSAVSDAGSPEDIRLLANIRLVHGGTKAEERRRVMLTLVNEAALLLAEGVAERATDVDVVLVNGYGFPRWEGGPVFWARERGFAALQSDLDELAALSGPGFVRGDVHYLLEATA